MKDVVPTLAWNQELQKLLVWNSCQGAPGRDPSEWKLDARWKLMRWSDHADPSSPYGWELERYPSPANVGGPDHPLNLRALNCHEATGAGGLLARLLKGLTA